MDKSEEELVEATRKEMESLGLKPAEPEAVEPTETTPEVKPETPEKEETKVEPKPEEVSNKEPSLKDWKHEYKETLKTELQAEFDKKLEEMKAEMSKTKPNEVTTENLEEEVKKLAAELQFDEAKTRRIIEVARKGIEPLTADDKKLLEEYRADKEARQAKDAEREQDEIFNTEWNEVLPSIKTQYPNATDEQLQSAKDALDELSHSEKYHEMDMDYILFKEKESLGKILFSPKQSTFESPRTAPLDDTSDEWPEITANMTPNQILAAEKKRERIAEGLGREKVKVTTRDDSGKAIERFE
jgi:hypothetical protein